MIPRLLLFAALCAAVSAVLTGQPLFWVGAVSFTVAAVAALHRSGGNR